MSDVNANIRVNVSTQEAQAQLAALQQQMNLLNKSMTNNMRGTMDLGVGNILPQLKGVHGEIVKVEGAASRLNKTLSKGGTLKMGQAFGNVRGAMKGNAATMELARRNAAELGTQYTLLGKQADGAMTAFKGGQMAGFNMDMAVAAQRSAILTRTIDQMGTSVLNWGKNMQWAGRQLMVGFTVPLTIFSAFALKSFRDISREVVNLQKVYGDFGTSAEETERVTNSIVALSSELTTLGFTAKETLALAADAAALGFSGNDLTQVTTRATEMAALGMMTQAEALNTVISLNSAFGVSVDNLSGSLDFLNAVENETILSMQDMAEAIPITATAVQGLGGDVQDLAVFMVAMREGGINANEAANSLKTSLARLITPTRQATETAAQFGINLNKLVAENEGDVLGMVQSLAKEMESLSNLQQQQLLSDVFGKRQFARMGALLNNINKEGSQAAKTLELMGMNASDLARITQDELNTLEESPVMQLNASIQKLQASLAPIGQLIASVITPVIEKLGGLLDFFNKLPDTIKQAGVVIAGVLGIIVPGFVMLIGLLGNFVGTMLNGLARLREYATGIKYMSTEEIGAQQAAAQLNTEQMELSTTLQTQSAIVSQLATNYDRLVASMSRVPAGGQMPGMPMRFATGGRVPGSGNTDKIPALLTPGEYVINKKQSQKHSGFLKALNSGAVSGFSTGYTPEVERMINNAIGSGFDGKRAEDILVSAAQKAGTVLGQATKKELMPVLKEWGYAGAGNKGPFTTSPTAQNAHLADSVVVHIDELVTQGLGGDQGRRAEKFIQEGGVSDSRVGVGVERLSDFTSYLPGGANQGARSGIPMNAESWLTSWTADSEKSKAAFKDQATALYEKGELSAEEYAATIRAIDDSHEKVKQELQQAASDTSQGPGGRAVTEQEMSDIVQRNMRESGAGKLVDTLTQPGATGRAQVSVPEDIQDDANRLLEADKQLQKAIADGDAARQAELEAEIAEIEEATGIVMRSREGRSGDIKREAVVGTSRSGLPEGYSLEKRKKWEIRDAAGDPVFDDTYTRTYFDESSSKGKKYSAASGDPTATAQNVDQQIRAIADSMFGPEDVAKIEARAREAGVSAIDALAEGIRQGSAEPDLAMLEVTSGLEEAANQGLEAASPSRATARSGEKAAEGVAQGIRENAEAPVREARNVGEQMELAFDESFDGHRAGQDAMQETGQGARSGGTGTGGGLPGIYMGSGTGTDKGKKPDAGAGQMGMFGDKKQMAGMMGGQLVSMAAFTAPSMLGDKLGEETGKMMQSVGMLSGQFMSFASMLAPPAGAIAGAIIGGAAMLGSALYGMWRDHQNKISEEAYKVGKSFGGVADAADKMANMLGRTTAAQRQMLVGLDDEQEKLYGEFTKSFESDMGKQIVAELNESSGTDRQLLAQEYMLAAMTNNQLSDEEAKIFAKALGAELNDGALGKSLERFVEDNSRQKGSEVAQEQAERRDTAIQEADAFADTSSLKGYMTALGAAESGLKSWTTVVATAKEDYRNGEISYNEYIDSLRNAQKAQDEYANKLFDLAGRSPDPEATKKALDADLLLSGYAESAVEASGEKLEAAADTNLYGEGWKKTISTSFLRYLPMKGGFSSHNEVRQKEQEQLASTRSIFMALGDDLEGATARTIELTDETSNLSKSYEKQIDAGKAVKEALEYAAIEQNAIGGSYGSEFQGLPGEQNRENLLSGLDSYQKVGGDAKQYLAAIEGFSGNELINFLETTNSLFRPGDVKQYIDAMASVNEVAGPKTAAAMSDTFAAIAGDPGKIAKTSEEVAELAGYLNNNDEAAERWVKYLETKNGKTDDDALAGANKRLAEFQGMDKEYLLKIGIDIESPDGGTGLLGEELWDADRAAQGKDYVMSQAEGWQQDFAAAGVMGAGSFELIDGEAVRSATEKSLNDIALASAELNDAVEAMGDEDIEVQKQATVDFIMTSAEGQGIDIDAGGAKAMIDNIIANSGIDEATFYSMPADDIAKVVNFEVMAEGARKAAAVFRQAAIIAMESGDMGLWKSMSQQALAFDELANLSQESAAAATTSGLSRSDTTGGSKSGGGGGGDKKDNWYTKLFEDEKESKRVLKETNKLLRENREIVDENSKLNREVIDALVADEEAYEDYQKDVKKRGSKKANQKVNEAYFGNMKREAKQDTAAMRTQKRREDLIDGAKDLDYFTKEQIKNDEKLLEMYEQGGDARDDAIEQAEKRAEIETTELDRAERRVELQREQNDLIRQGMELAIKQEEYNKENKFFENTGTDRATINQLNEEYDAEMRLIQLRDIKPIQDKIDAQRDFIRELEREYEINEDNIEAYQKQVDDRQRIVEDMQRALELRQREGEMLDHDLKLMSYIEEEINETYDERIEALDKVASINEQISQSQQDQLGLADALSRGDIGAAAQAAQQMQQNQMQFAADQYRNQLEVNKESAVNNLTGAESGMTREQIEERQRELEEDSYQTNLQIRAVEDEIYDLNRQIRNENDIIAGYKDKIEVHNKNIRDYEWQIYDIENDRLKTLEDMKYQNDLMLAGADLAVTKAASTAKIELANFDRQTEMWDAEETYQLARARWEEDHGERMQENLKLLRKSTRQANEYYRGIREGKGALLDIPKLETIEFKSMEIDKAGLSTLTADLNEAFNNYQSGVNVSSASASYNVPTTAVPQAAVNGIMGNVTNNYNNNNVNVNAASANAQEVAQIVLREINLQEGRNVK